MSADGNLSLFCCFIVFIYKYFVKNFSLINIPHFMLEKGVVLSDNII